MNNPKQELSGDNLKWVVQVDYQGNLVYLTQEEYEKYSAVVQQHSPQPFFGIKRTGELITTRPVSITINPFYVDPVKKKKILKKRQLIEEYEMLKAEGKFIKFRDFLRWKKNQNV